jgi:hypothetical protein
MAATFVRSRKFSIRAIARTFQVARSNFTQPKTAKFNVYKKARDEDLLKQIKELLETRPSYGSRRVAAYINRTLKEDRCAVVNHKRIYRLMKINRPLLRKPEHRPKRLHEGKVETLRSNTRWCSDSFSIQCSKGFKNALSNRVFK